jgi:glycerophosphoryl diester phosphodiesterase
MIRILPRWVFVGLILMTIAGGPLLGQTSDAVQPHYTRLSDPASLQFYMRWTPDREPLISAHRGGPLPGFPENSIAAFENSLTFGPCLIEIDVRKTLDGVMILMHDRTLDRTTTDSGLVAEATMDRILELNLIDGEGDTTDYGVPTFRDALEWGRGKAIFTVDVKRGVEPRDIARMIHETRAEPFAIVITYNADQAQAFHELMPEIMLSVGIRNEEDLRRLMDRGIPPTNMVAFTGVSKPDKELLDLLHEHGIRAIVGTMGNLDRSAEVRGTRIYRELYRNGADILSTDNVPLVARAIKELQLKRGDRR